MNIGESQQLGLCLRTSQKKGGAGRQAKKSFQHKSSNVDVTVTNRIAPGNRSVTTENNHIPGSVSSVSLYRSGELYVPGSFETSHPPPKALTSSTLASMRRRKISTSVMFILEGDALRRDHVEICHQPALIPLHREIQRLLRRFHRHALRLRLLLQNAQCRQIVFHFLEGRQRCLTVIRHRLIVRCADLLRHGAPPSGIENSFRQGWPHRPEDGSAKLSQLTGLFPRNPPVAVSTRLGKNAARAIPICSFASAIRRSAAAISGRLSSNCAGTPVGITGGEEIQRHMLQTQALRCPTHQCGNGMFVCRPRHPHSDVLGARVVSNCVRACATSALELNPP